MKIILIYLISILVLSSSAFAASPLSANEDQNVDLDLLFEKALELAKNSKFNDAIFYFDEILKYDPDHVLSLNNKGVMLMELEKYDEALSYYEKAIEINPDFIEAINNKALALHNLNRDADALLVLDNAFLIDSSNLITVENMVLIADTLPFVEVFGYAKIEIRNSDDQLVGYTESHDLFFRDIIAMMSFERKEWKPTMINGKEFEVLEHSINLPIEITSIYPRTDIALLEEQGFGLDIITISHNGFLIASGDKAKLTIVLFRPG